MMHRTAELARAMHAPTWRHWKAAQHLLAYLKGTLECKLVFRKVTGVTRDNFTFVGCVDSDYLPKYDKSNCGVYDNYKSTTGWVFTINDVAFSWRTRQQPLLADSTGAAELMAATDATKQAIWLRRMFADLGFPQSAPTTLFEDNASATKLSANYCAHDRVKHLDLRDMMCREHHQRKLTKLVQIGTNDQLADQNTKVLAGPAVVRFRNWALLGKVPQDCDHTALAVRAM